MTSARDEGERTWILNPDASAKLASSTGSLARLTAW